MEYIIQWWDFQKDMYICMCVCVCARAPMQVRETACMYTLERFLIIIDYLWINKEC